MREGPLTMVLHGALVAVVLYLLMKYVLGQSDAKALTRSVLLGLLVAVYMLVFGHGLPNRVNSNL
jgi:hypothetical protein